MLEHADGDDAIKTARHLAIVGQLEGDALHRRVGGSFARIDELLPRKGPPQPLGGAGTRERPCHPAPAGADVEHGVPRLKAKLGDDVPRLRPLRLFQARALMLEIGTGIVPVPIEEQLVEPSVQVVVMRDVALRAGGQVAQSKAAQRRAGAIQQPRRKRMGARWGMATTEGKAFPPPARQSASRTRTGAPLPSPKVSCVPRAVTIVRAPRVTMREKMWRRRRSMLKSPLSFINRSEIDDLRFWKL